MEVRNIVNITIKDHATESVPLFAYGRNNWMATIVTDKTQPIGFDRKFWQLANVEGFCYIVPEGLKVNTPIEMASDENSRDRMKERKRIYYVVVAISDKEISLEQYATGRAAISAATKKQQDKVCPNMFLSDINKLMIIAFMCEVGWQLPSGEIIADPYPNIRVGNYVWVLESAVSGIWTYNRTETMVES